jgi:hypothetical protein
LMVHAPPRPLVLSPQRRNSLANSNSNSRLSRAVQGRGRAG